MLFVACNLLSRQHKNNKEVFLDPKFRYVYLDESIYLNMS